MNVVKWPVVLLLTGIMSNVSYAATSTGNLTVWANVIQACTIVSVSDISFGDYDPVGSTHKDGQGSFTFSCLGGTNYELYITGARKMTGPMEDFLNYELYTDGGRTNVWPSAKPSSENGVTSSSDPITRDVYGRIPAAQQLPVGTYTNILSIVVDF